MKFNDYWKIPRNAKKFFSPKQEKELKAKYGIWYTFHTILSIVILLCPFFVFLFLLPSNAFEPTTQSSNLLGAIGGIIGLIGSFSIGVGLVNVFMTFVKQYLGHIVLAEHNITQNMSRKGNCMDNGAMENFFGRLKVEMFYGEKFESVNAFIDELKKYIHYYNNELISLKLKGMSPVQYRTHSLTI